MKKSILLLLTASVTESFLIVPHNQVRRAVLAKSSDEDVKDPITGMIHTLESAMDGWKQKDDTHVTRDLESAQKEWKEEADRMHKLEHAVETDPDLAGMVEPSHKEVHKTYLDKEAHRHDSLFAEVEHALETDPDLANVVAHKGGKRVDAGFMDKEAHVHDSLLNEIEHSLDTDPDLSM